MSDLISRQAAIDALKEVSEHYTDKGREWHPHVDFMVQAIEELPTAEPEWIPVTERLPKENGDYLVTGRQGAVNKRKYEDGRWYGNWAVVAWMPLPAPWKGEDYGEGKDSDFSP